ncbi:MAG: ABC transporter ATP-binding protein [Clostridia bacterium]|nr:ABC transporter ATP-binding protein [Clostridia bacterium]
MEKDKVCIKKYTRQFYKNNGWLFFIALIQTLFEGAVMLVISWLLQQLVDLASGSTNGLNLLQLTIVALVVLALSIISSVITYHTRPKFIARGMAQYKEYVFEKLTKKSISAFSAENTTSYISALTNDLASIEKGYLENIFTLILHIFMFVGAFAMMIIYSPLLTLIAVGLTILPLIVTLLTGNKVAEAESKLSKENEGYTLSITDSLNGFSVIKSFKAEKKTLQIFIENLKRIASVQGYKEKMKVLVQSLSSITGIVVQIGVFIFGVLLSIMGYGVTAGTTIIFVQLMNYVLQPIGVVPTCLAERKAAKALIQKTATKLEENVRKEVKGEKITLKKGIEIKGLSFSYEEEKPVLNDVNCFFEVGKKYALVGASGSGKSTFLRLLTASYPNYSGQILYDGVELKDISSENLYDAVSVIQQNVFVFNASVKDNITMFSEFPPEQIETAVRLSGLATLVEEKGEDYLCGENGVGLSGGEKQRVSIARSLLKKAQILLVDEGTAALDKETAHQVSNAILGLDGVTEIIITHALEESLLKKYDGILTMKGGRIIESGTFDELMDKKGYFYSLFTISQ